MARFRPERVRKSDPVCTGEMTGFSGVGSVCRGGKAYTLSIKQSRGKWDSPKATNIRPVPPRGRPRPVKILSRTPSRAPDVSYGWPLRGSLGRCRWPHSSPSHDKRTYVTFNKSQPHLARASNSGADFRRKLRQLDSQCNLATLARLMVAMERGRSLFKAIHGMRLVPAPSHVRGSDHRLGAYHVRRAA